MKKLVFLTGAGISVESGLSTFRGAGGMWGEYPVEQVATHSGWLRDPVLVNNFYNKMRHQLIACQPNEAHRIIHELEQRFSVTVVTQNVDDLHERAGQTRVVHLHGELMKVCSSADVDNPRYQRTLSAPSLDVAPGELAGDGSLLRPFIVFFEESVPMISVAAQEVAEADVFVIVGTSLAVYPAAGLIGYVRHGTPVYLIDPADVPVGGVTHIRATASEGMRQLREILLK